MAPILSVLDLSPVTTATPPSQALHNTLDLAAHCDGLGFHRYWLAEHHNLATIASSSPPIMIAQVAARTQHMRVGSGGIMLPNHAPLIVAEQFRTLEALFPGRIDLAVGRAPGTDRVAMIALRRRMDGADQDDFLERLHETMALGTDRIPPDHPFSQIEVMPSDVPLPPVWILGSSEYGAQVAGQLGLGYGFAHHFASFPAEQALRLYREAFRPSQWLDRPHAILGVSAICGADDDEAEHLAGSVDLHWLRMMQGGRKPLADPREVAGMAFTDAEREAMRRNRERHAVGGPARVKARLDELARATGADELMVTSMIFDHEARKRSYSHIADVHALSRRAA